MRKREVIILIIASLFVFGMDYAFSTECDDVLNSCTEAVISQEATIAICTDLNEKKDAVITMAKADVAATEKSLSNQKVATTTGFSLSTLLLLLLLL